jgi:hypothetical protein
MRRNGADVCPVHYVAHSDAACDAAARYAAATHADACAYCHAAAHDVPNADATYTDAYRIATYYADACNNACAECNNL